MATMASQRMSGSSKQNLALRLGTAGVFAPLIIYLLYFGPAWGFVTLAGIMCGLGAAELYRMVAPRQWLVHTWGVAATLCVFGCFAIAPETRILGLVVVGVMPGIV